MPTTIGTAYVQILPTTEGITENLTSTLTESASTAASEAGEKSGSTLGSSIASGLKTAGTVIAGAATAAVGGMTALVNSTASYGDSIDKASQKLGVSSTFYQEWDAVLQHSGTSMSNMTSTFKTLANAAQDATDDQAAAFEQLGLSMDEVANMSTEDLFTAVITGLQGMEEGTERTALATDLLGRGATEMGALLNTSAEDTQGMIDTVNELGGVMSESAVKDAAAYEDALQDMQTSFSGIKNSVGAEVMPMLTDLMDTITENMPQIEAAVTPVLNGIGDAVSSIATFIQEHWDTISAIFDGIGSTISVLWDAISGIIESFVTAFQTATESISGGGLEIQDVFNAINVVIAYVGDAISQIIEGIGEVIGWLVTEAQTDGTFINAVWENIQTVCSTVFAAVGDVIQLFIDLLHGDFSGVLQDAKDLVSDVFGGIQELITNSMDFVWDKVSGIFSDIYDTITEKMQGAHDFISDIIDNIKNFFSFEITWPHIPLPHINYTLISVPLLGNIPDPTSISISWYAKAMNTAAVLDGATIFGAANGQLLAGGEAGPEVVSGESHLIELIQNSVSDSLAEPIIQVAALMKQYMPAIASKQLVMPVSVLADEADYELQRRARREAAAFA